MSFLHCHNCSWEQDDFWSINGWNPFHKSRIEALQNILRDGLNGKKTKLDLHFAEDIGIEYEEVDGAAYVDFKEMILWELDRIKRIVLNMTWFTEEDFRNDPNPICPQCGSSEDWDID